MIKRIFFLLFSVSCFSQSGYKFVTDFETTQWSPTGTAATETWETEPATEVRVVTDAYEASRAIWLGSFNNDGSRNEIALVDLVDKEETWWGFAMKVVTPLSSARTMFQLRPLREGGGVGSGVTNLMTIRQGSSPGLAYIQTSTIPENVNTIYTSGANPSGCCDSYNFDYVVGEWFTVVVHSIFHPTSGRLEVWIDGEKLIDITGTTAYNFAHNDGEPYDTNRTSTKLGPYWATTTPVGDVYYDRFSVWEGSDGSYEKVHPLGLSPGAGGGTPPIIITTGSGKQKTQTAQLISN